MSDLEQPTALLIALLPKSNENDSLMYPPENIEIVRALLTHGARVNCDGFPNYDTDTRYTTPLFEAIQSSKTATCHLLLESGADVRNTPYYPLVWTATTCGGDKTDIIADLIEHGADVNEPGYRGVTALCAAAKLGYVDVTRLLLAHHANLSVRDVHGSTPLQAAKKKATPELGEFPDLPELERINHGRRQIVKILIAAGAKE